MSREFADFLNVMIWMDIRVCFPFTLLAIGLCFMVHLDYRPITYYVNLLIANLIQLITMIFIVNHNTRNESLNSTSLIIYCSFAMVSLYFRMIIALERCFFIIWPQVHFIRLVKGSVIICVLVWVLGVTVSLLLIFLDQRLIICILALIPSPIFIFCTLGTFISLSGPSSVSAEGRRRIVGTFILLLVNFTLTIVSPVCGLFSLHPSLTEVLITLFIFSPFMDLFLFVFMRKGPIDDFLSCLCCCKMETSAVDDDSRLSI